MKEVLDRIELPEDDQIPDNATADASVASKWRIPGTRVTIAHFQDAPGKGTFLFDAGTVRQAAKLYSAAKQLPYRDEGRKSLTGFPRSVYSTHQKSAHANSRHLKSARNTHTLSRQGERISMNGFAQTRMSTVPPQSCYQMLTQILRCLDVSNLPEYAREDYAAEASCLS